MKFYAHLAFRTKGLQSGIIYLLEHILRDKNEQNSSLYDKCSSYLLVIYIIKGELLSLLWLLLRKSN